MNKIAAMEHRNTLIAAIKESDPKGYYEALVELGEDCGRLAGRSFEVEQLHIIAAIDDLDDETLDKVTEIITGRRHDSSDAFCHPEAMMTAEYLKSMSGEQLLLMKFRQFEAINDALMYKDGATKAGNISPLMATYLRVPMRDITDRLHKA